jgi:hypothetical protein
MGVRDSHWCGVTICQYSAAHLIVEIIDYPQTPIDVCTEFPVTARITNIGDADAWEAQAMISVFPEGSARVSANDQYGSYTRDLGNIIGHGVDESVEVTWLMHCKQECDTTITVNARGYDEFGYEVKQICATEIVGGDHYPGPPPYQITCCELLLDGTPGAPILPRFIEPASVTVKQMAAGTGGDNQTNPGAGNFDITLGAGWNLISCPWYIDPADRAPATLLGPIAGSLQTAYGWDTAAGWKTYTPGAPGTLVQMRDGPGYWLLMNAPATLSIVGQANPLPPAPMPEYSVVTGWNLIGPKNGHASVVVDNYLAGTSFKVVYGYNNSTGAYYQVLSGAVLDPGTGYWVAFLAPGTIYP